MYKKEKKLFRNHLISSLGTISKNHTYEIGNDIHSQNSNIDFENQPYKNRDLTINTPNLILGNFTDVEANHIKLNRYSTSVFTIPSVEYIPENKDVENQNQIEKIFKIFYKLLDDDKDNNAQKDIQPEVLNYILKYIKEVNDSVLLKTENQSDVDSMNIKVKNIVNLYQINNIRFINKFFESVNNKLLSGGIFIGCVETYNQRKNRIFKKFPTILAGPYYVIDFIFKRAFPKNCLTKKLYYSITLGKNRVLSLAETLGRLVSCGFKIIDYVEINNQTYFTVKRISEPVYDKTPSYGFLIKLKRISKDGKIINIYKCRTMHPYSEYLQEYIFQNNYLKKGGKFDNDFRITKWGKILRKYRFDEIPMLLNLLKGELKLFGVRPLSLQYYNMYEENIRQRRIRYKPGLIPPFFVDLPKTFREILDSEIRYLDSFDLHPFKTDWKYFWKVMYNINIKHVMGE